MPIYKAPQVSKNPVFGFGAGDLFVAAGADSMDPEAGNRYLLIYRLRQGGSIGTVEDTGRDDGIPEGSTTATCPADLVLYFATEDSLDQVLAVLLSIKDGFRKRAREGATAVAKGAPGMTDLMVPPESITHEPEMLDLELEDAPPIQTANDGEALQGTQNRACGMYEGCRGYGYIDDSTDSGSGHTVYCDCMAGKALEKFESETRAERGERLAERYTREDGSPK